MGVIHWIVGVIRLGVGVTRNLGVIPLRGVIRPLGLTLLVVRGPLRMGSGRLARCRAIPRGVVLRLHSPPRLCRLVVRLTRSRLVMCTILLRLAVWTRIMSLPAHPLRLRTLLCPLSPQIRIMGLLRFAPRSTPLQKCVRRSIAPLMCVRRSMSLLMYVFQTSHRRSTSLRNFARVQHLASVLPALL